MGKFIFGVLLGVIIAIGLVLYLNNNPTKFVNKFINVNNDNINNPISLQPSMAIEAIHNKESVVNNLAESGDYDFYKILEHKNTDERINTNENKIVKNYYFNIGPFSNQEKANDMAARLALIGYEARIITESSEYQGIGYNVIIGPYVNKNDVVSIQNSLKNNAINGKIISNKLKL